MVRNVLGSVVALLGAAAAVLSPFRIWYDGRLGRDIRVRDLFEGISGRNAVDAESMLLPMLFAALLTLIGAALRSRLTVTLAGLLVLGFTALWMVRQAQATGRLTVSGDGLREGAGLAVGGGVALLFGALVMKGRWRARLRRERDRQWEREREAYEEEDRYADGHHPGGLYPDDPYGDERYANGPYAGERYGGGYGEDPYGDDRYGEQYGGEPYRDPYAGGQEVRGPYGEPRPYGHGGPEGWDEPPPERTQELPPVQQPGERPWRPGGRHSS